MPITERSFSSEDYRYGFNGMERAPEISPGAFTTKFRELDTRLGGRWWSKDPIVKPWESPYAGFSNNPIFFIDPSGLDPTNKSVCFICGGENPGGQGGGNGNQNSSGNNNMNYDYETTYKGPDPTITADREKRIDDTRKDVEVKWGMPQDPNKPSYDNNPYIGEGQWLNAAITDLEISFEMLTYENPNVRSGSPDFIGGLYKEGFNLLKLLKGFKFKGWFKSIQSLMYAAKTGLQLESSVAKVMGNTYKAAGEVTAPIKNTELLTKLNATSKGDWVKVYEAGLQNGSKIETHYFRNNTTGQVFDVKTRYKYWHQKSFKNLGQ